MNLQNERLWQLVSLKLSGEATPLELQELDALIKEHPQVVFQIEILEKVWRHKQDAAKADVEYSFNKHLRRLGHQLSAPLPIQENQAPEEPSYPQNKRWQLFKKPIGWISGLAASLLVIVLLLQWLDKDKRGTEWTQNAVSTKPGSKSKIQLPDGTQVWLNADSKITYNEDFEGKNREVFLTGEAYFDVVKDESRPFIIHTHAMDIKVLGTAFNVRSYPDDKTVETALIRGAVEVMLRDKAGKKIILQPNEKLVLQNHKPQLEPAVIKQAPKDLPGPVITIAPVHSLGTDSSTYETSWVRNRLAFDGESLEQVALKIGRWFGVKVTITSDKLKQGTYTGWYEEENLGEVLASLRLSGNFHYTISRNEVIIKP